MQANRNLRVGTLSDLQGRATIGNYTRFTRTSTLDSTPRSAASSGPFPHGSVAARIPQRTVHSRQLPSCGNAGPLPVLHDYYGGSRCQA